MSKRKLEAADEQSAAPEQSKRTKKQKTNTTRTSEAAPRQHNAKGSVQTSAHGRNEKLARKLAKREREALKDPQRSESEHKNGSKAGDYNDNTGLVGIQERELLEHRQTAAPKNRHESREKAQEGGQKLTKKNKSKKKKRNDRTVESSGKKSRERAVDAATWKVSDSLGGQMLDVDLVFSPDEK